MCFKLLTFKSPNLSDCIKFITSLFAIFCCVKYKAETKENLYPFFFVFFVAKLRITEQQKIIIPHITEDVLCFIFTKYMYQARSIFFESGVGQTCISKIFKTF